MLIIDISLWPILQLSFNETWGENDLVEETFAAYRTMLLKAASEGYRCTQIVTTDEGTWPTMGALLRVISGLRGSREAVETGLEKTIWSFGNPSHKTWVEMALSFYTPSRPMHYSNTEIELKSFLTEDENQRYIKEKAPSVTG
jgi:hypothetical protein